MRGRLLIGLLAVVIIAGAAVQLLNTTGVQDTLSDEANARSSVVRAYLLHVKIAEDPFDEKLGPALDAFIERNPPAPTVREALAVVFHLEGDKDKATVQLEALPADYPRETLRYALGVTPQEQTPAEGWEAEVEKDWLGARMRALIHERLGDDQAESIARMEMIEYLDEARVYYQIQTPRNMFSLIGLALLISLFLSDRQWRRLGKDDFFRLKPLHFPSELVLRFCLPFFLGLFIISLMVLQFQGLPNWLLEVGASLLYIAWGVYLLRRVVFNNEPGLMTEALGLKELNMRPFNLVQVFGGFAMVTACHYYAEMLAGLVHWPIYSINPNDTLGALSDNTVALMTYGFAACIVAPFFEEIFFRGFLLRVMLNNMRPMAALWCSALLFGVMHPFALWPLVIFKGFALGVVYYRTANLMVVIWTHAAWNLVILLIGISGMTGA